MNSFINRWSEGSYGIKQVAQTLMLVMLCFFLGNLPAAWVFAHHGIMDLWSASVSLGFDAVFLLQMIPFLAVLAALLIAARKIHKVRLLDWVCKRPQPAFGKVLFGFLCWGGFLICTVLIQKLVSPNSLRWNFDPALFFRALFLLLLFLPLQVLAEELLFRSYALQGLTARLKKPWLAILLSGIMFGAMHLGNPEIQKHGLSLLTVYCVFGIFLSAITALDGGIELAYGFHLSNNLFSAILVTSKDQALQIPSILSSDSGMFDMSSLLLLFLGLTAFYLFSKHRFAWKEASLMQNIP